MSINEKITKLFEVRNKIAEIKSKELKALEEEKSELEDEIKAYLLENEIDKAAIKGVGTVSLNSAIVPQAKDWNQVYKYIADNDAFYLLNRALNAASYREALELGQEIPGLEPFKKTSLSVRKAA